MREIKFRAWIIRTDGCCSINKMRYECNQTIFDWEADGVTMKIMQFTGLKDKNGKEIYEGDILIDDSNEIHEVIFGELPLDKAGDCVCTFPAFYCKCYGKIGQAPMHQCQEIGSWMIVKGNIYENPELIGK